MAQVMNGMIETLHDQSLPAIGLLQASFPNNYKFMINISTLFDPKYVFLIYAPILFALNKRVGHRMIIALTWAEWANQCLKWLLAGERPYWYVHERANELARRRNLTDDFGDFHTSDAEQALSSSAGLFAEPRFETLTGQLKQFPVTCELGAGSPSGHAMMTATVWYILIDALLKRELAPFSRADYANLSAGRRAAGQQAAPALESLLAKTFWSVYLLMLVLVSLSRVYLACHFPHQCLAGALIGCVMAHFVAQKLDMERLQKRHFVLATVWMFASAMATYALLRMTGFDPLWSVGKAMRWCVNSAYIHMDTTPFYSMMRYLGFALGAGLAYDANKLATSTQELLTGRRLNGPSLALTLRRLLALATAIGFGQLLLAVPLPKANQHLFYAANFLLYTLLAYAMAGPIPDLVKASFRVLKAEQPLERVDLRARFKTQ